MWDNIVKEIEGGEWNDELSVDENLSTHEQIEQIKKRISALEKKARAEKQPKKSFEYVSQINKLKLLISDMVEHSQCIIAYVTHGWGGAAATLKAAQNKNLQIINIGSTK